MFHAAQALLRTREIRYRKHSGVHAGLAAHFVKPGLLDRKYHRWLIDAFDERVRADYDVDYSGDVEGTRIWLDRAREFLAEARRLLGTSSEV